MHASLSTEQERYNCLLCTRFLRLKTAVAFVSGAELEVLRFPAGRVLVRVTPLTSQLGILRDFSVQAEVGHIDVPPWSCACE